MGEKRLVPELRFPDFKKHWVIKKIQDVSTKVGSGKTPKGGEEVYQKEGIPFIRSQNVNNDGLLIDETHIPHEVHESMNGSQVLPNDILLNITGGSIGRSCVVPSDFKEGNVNQHVSIIRLKKDSPKFLQSILSSWRGQKLIYQGQTGSGREGLNFKSIKGFKIYFPSISEQQKIATFITSVDLRIQFLEKKKANLEAYKKGVMQKIFSQEVRFKDENGNSFPDWEKKKLKDVFNGLKGTGLSKDKLSEKGKYKCVLYGELFTRYKEVITDIVSSTDTEEGILSKENDLLVPCSTTTSGIDLANVTALKDSNVLIGGDITILRAKKEVDNIFYAYYLSNHKKLELAKFGQGTTIVHLYFNHFKGMIIDIPSVKEQQKIVAFLSNIDKNIEQITQQIEKSKSFKKGLLQRMFV
jgi:type I restriction enzyme S subunit